MFQARDAGAEDVLGVGYARELVAESTRVQRADFDGAAQAVEKAMTDARRCGALLATFAISLLTPVGYFVAVVVGWVDWAAGLPAAVVAMFLAWTCAIRINELARSVSRH